MSVVVPALKEELDLVWLVERLPRIVDEVILVDCRSTDDTVAIARALRPDIRVLHEPAPDEGARVAAAFAAATGDHIVVLDSDRTLEPAGIEPFVVALEAGCALFTTAWVAGPAGTRAVA